ncbi:hypothetical protein [Microtetraspora malaysiensis]|uniref:hypothetical protein n=1 Tax=Microtetraspora malaysiensis TaxID=161358 RepID=UPI003D93A409
MRLLGQVVLPEAVPAGDVLPEGEQRLGAEEERPAPEPGAVEEPQPGRGQVGVDDPRVSRPIRGPRPEPSPRGAPTSAAVATRVPYAPRLAARAPQGDHHGVSGTVATGP